MLRNTEITNLTNAVLMKLMPLSTRIPNQELWAIYNQLQEWKLNVEWKYPGIGTDRSLEMASAILQKLDTLSDRKLAQEIKRTVNRYSPPTEKTKAKDALRDNAQPTYVYIAPLPSIAQQAFH